MGSLNTWYSRVSSKYILLWVLIIFHIINNVLIVLKDTTPFLWDGGDYFYRSLRFYDLLSKPGADFFSQFNSVSPYRPPLFLLSSSPLYLLFGKSPDIAVFTNIIFMVILLLSVYGIGKIYGNEETGLLASFTVSTFPVLYGLSRNYWTDFSLTAMVTLSIYLLLKSEGFTKDRYNILFGISIGLGMLTKWTYFIFLSGPLIYLLLPSVRGTGKDNSVIKNLLKSVLIGSAVSAFWYLPHGLSVAGKLFGLALGVRGTEATRFQQLGETIGPTGIFNVKSLTFFAGQLVNHQITFVYSLLFIISLYILFKKPEKKFFLMIFWIAIPVLLFTLIKNKTIRNTVPMLPAVGIIIALAVSKVNSQRVKKIITIVMVFAGVFQYIVTSYGSDIIPKKVGFNTPIGDIIFFQQPRNTSYALYYAQTGDWKTDDILNTIRDSSEKKEGVKIVLMPRDAFTWMSMEYSSYLRELPFELIGAVVDPEAVMQADFLLVKKGGFIAPWFLMENMHRSFDLLEENYKDFKLIKQVELPQENSFLPIYDIKAARQKSHKVNIIYSDNIKLREYYIAEEHGRDYKRFIVSLKIEGIDEQKEDIVIILKVLNKKMEILEKKAVAPVILNSGGNAGNHAGEIKASVSVPMEKFDKIFSIDLGFYNKGERRLLTYHPEYLIYKRINN